MYIYIIIILNMIILLLISCSNDLVKIRNIEYGKNVFNKLFGCTCRCSTKLNSLCGLKKEGGTESKQRSRVESHLYIYQLNICIYKMEYRIMERIRY